MDDLPLGGTTSKVTSEGSPAPSSKRLHLGTRYPNRVTQKHSAGTPVQWGRLGRSTLRETPPTSPWMECMICQRSSGTWPRQLGYWAWPFTSCDKLTMPWDLYQKASNSSEQYPHWSSQRLWDWWAYMTQMPFATSMAWLTVTGVGRRARMRVQLSTTFGWCTTGLAWCATNVTTTCQPPQTLSTTMAGRTVYPQGRQTLMSQPHQSNCQQETGRFNLSSLGI